MSKSYIQSHHKQIGTFLLIIQVKYLLFSIIDQLTQQQIMLHRIDKLHALRLIPQSLLPLTLKHGLKLQNISRIQITYRPGCKNIGYTFQFLRKYGADLRYHNPELQIIREKSQNGPLELSFKVFKYQKFQVLISPSKLNDTNAIKDQLLRINEQL